MFLMWLACGSNSDDDTLTQVFVPQDTAEVCEFDDDCSSEAICLDGECQAGDRDDTFDGASAIRQNEVVDRAIEPEADIDTFVYTSLGAEWLRIQTEVTDGDLNTVVAVYASNGALYAAMDDYPTGPVSTWDTVLYVYLPTAAEWFVTVEDRGTWYADPPNTGGYTLEILPFEATVDEPDASDDVDVDIELIERNTTWALGVLIGAPTDSDWFTVDMAFSDTPVEVYGYDQPGSSIDIRVRATDALGTLIGDSTYLGTDPLVLLTSTIGLYTFEVSDDAQDGDESAWTVLYITTEETREPYEWEQEPNNDQAQAFMPSVAELFTSDETPYYAVYPEGDFSDGTSDWVAFEMEDGEIVSARCWAEIWGSLAELQVAAYDQSGANLTPSDQGSDWTGGNYYVYNISAEGEGTYALELTDFGATYGQGSYWRCALFLTPFEVDPEI